MAAQQGNAQPCFAATQRFSQALATTYLQLVQQRIVATDLSDARLAVIEEAWVALVGPSHQWSLSLSHLGTVVDRVGSMKGSYQPQELQAVMRLLDMNQDGQLDYLEFKAYMAIAHGNGCESGRRRRGRHCDSDTVEDLALLGSRCLSEIFEGHRQLTALAVHQAQKAHRAAGMSKRKTRTPFRSLPNFDSELAAQIRNKSINTAMAASSCSHVKLEASQLAKDLGERLQAMEQLRGQPLMVSREPAARRDSEIDKEEEEESEEEAEQRRQRQRLLLREEQVMMKQGSMMRRVQGPSVDAADDAALQLQTPQPVAERQQGGSFTGLFRKLGQLFGGSSAEGGGGVRNSSTQQQGQQAGEVPLPPRAQQQQQTSTSQVPPLPTLLSSPPRLPATPLTGSPTRPQAGPAYMQARSRATPYPRTSKLAKSSSSIDLQCTVCLSPTSDKGTGAGATSGAPGGDDSAHSVHSAGALPYISEPLSLPVLPPSLSSSRTTSGDSVMQGRPSPPASPKWTRAGSSGILPKLSLRSSISSHSSSAAR